MLPWQSLYATTKNAKYERIKEKKIDTPIEKLCQGYPSEFAQYLQLTRNMKFEEQPDYTFLKTMFRNLFNKKEYTFDYQYDWVKKAE